MFAKIKNRKIILFAVLAAVLVAGGAPVGQIQAQEAGGAGAAVDMIGGVSLIAVTVPITSLLYIVKHTLAYIITFIAYLADSAIELGNGVLKLAAVQSGWEVMLNFTNLGFVLGIIIIAFATILRLESYAIKQTLWKLIVAALLVNFSLVICGGIISISKITTDTFQNHITAGGKTMGDVLGTLAQPQKLQKVESENFLEKAAGVVKDLTNLATVSGALKLIIALVIQIIMDFLIILTFLTLVVMLLVRVMALIFLVILSPIVWLLWIFPNTQKYWQQWWQEFIRWNFFAPVIMFFIYLAVLTQNKVGELLVNMPSSAQKALQDNTILPGTVWGDITNNFVILALLFGGIYVANKFGIAGGSIGINLAKGVGKGAGAWAGRKSLQLGTAPLRAKWFGKEGDKKSVGEKAVELASKTGWIGRHTLGYAARGITRLETAGGENILKQHAKSVANMSDADLKASVLTVSGPRKIAATKELQKRKLLGDVDAKNLITEENQSLFGRFRQGVSWGDVEHGAKMNIKMAKQLRDTGEASEELVREFTSTYKGKDIEASAIKDLYSGKAKLGLSQDNINKLGAQFAKTLAMENHQMVPKIIPTMSAKERAIFSQHYEDQILTLPNEWMNKNNRRVTLQEVSDAWDKTMSNYAMGFSSEAPIAGTTPPPSTP